MRKNNIKKLALMKKANIGLDHKRYFKMIVKAFSYKEIITKIGYSIYSKKSYVNHRNLLLRLNKPRLVRKIKNPNMKILLKHYYSLNNLRSEFKYFLSYDGFENKHESDFWQSGIRFFFCKYDNNKVKILENYVLIHQKGSHSENLDYIIRLYEMFLKQTKYYDVVRNEKFYIIADKHRAIVSFMNKLKVKSYISSNPTTNEKLERHNYQIKKKLYSNKSIESFRKDHKEISVLFVK